MLQPKALAVVNEVRKAILGKEDVYKRQTTRQTCTATPPSPTGT